jgi:hypothetical protein
MKTKKQGKACDKKNWSEEDLHKRCNIVIDTDNVKVVAVDGALFKMSKKTQQGKLLFYHEVPMFSSDKQDQGKVRLCATIEIRMPIKTLQQIADGINKQYATIQNQTSLHNFTDSEKHESHIMFG